MFWAEKFVSLMGVIGMSPSEVELNDGTATTCGYIQKGVTSLG
jgi:hypothetical protein